MNYLNILTLLLQVLVVTVALAIASCVVKLNPLLVSETREDCFQSDDDNFFFGHPHDKGLDFLNQVQGSTGVVWVDLIALQF